MTHDALTLFLGLMTVSRNCMFKLFKKDDFFLTNLFTERHLSSRDRDPRIPNSTYPSHDNSGWQPP